MRLGPKTSPAPFFPCFTKRKNRLPVNTTLDPADNTVSMKKLLFSIIFVLAGNSLYANDTQFGLDSNTAFYEGENLNYIMTPPDHYRLVIYQAKEDGYSFAFIPGDAMYDSSDVIIGVHIYKIRGMSFRQALVEDTSAIRSYFGQKLVLNPVESLKNGDGHTMTTFYLDNKEMFIPNVMMSYYDGGPEMIIFELVITDRIPRFKAEDMFVDCIKRFKTLKKGELGMK